MKTAAAKRRTNANYLVYSFILGKREKRLSQQTSVLQVVQQEHSKIKLQLHGKYGSYKLSVNQHVLKLSVNTNGCNYGCNIFISKEKQPTKERKKPIIVWIFDKKYEGKSAFKLL